MPSHPHRLALAIAAGLVLSAAPAVAAPGPGEVGSVAADFSLPDLEGTVHTLGQHRGQVVLLCIVGYG